MKRTLITAIALLVHAACYSQDCLIKKDDFTGKTIKTGTTVISGTMLTGVAFGFYNEDGHLGISYLYRTASKQPIAIDSLLIMAKLENGDIKKFKLNKMSTAKEILGVQTVALYADINSEDLAMFENHPIAKIRVGHEGESYGFDMDVSDSKAKKIIKSISCIR